MPPTKRAIRRRPAQPRPRPDRDERDIDEPEENGDEERPRPSKRVAAKASSKSPIKGGYSAAQRVMDSTSSFAQAFKPDERSQIIKFLEDSPYASFRRHWIDSVNKEGQKMTRAYTCLIFGNDPHEECPVCDTGDRPQAVSAYNVAIVEEDGSLVRKSWDVGARLYNVLKGYSNDPKIAPLTRGFFLVSKTGKRGSVQYNVSPIKASVLEEDYDIPVPEQSELDRLERYTPSIVDVPPIKKMREIAAELVEDYD